MKRIIDIYLGVCLCGLEFLKLRALVARFGYETDNLLYTSRSVVQLRPIGIGPSVPHHV